MSQELVRFESQKLHREIWLAAPGQFVREHQRQLLPTWKEPIATTLIMLQKARFSLTEEKQAIELEKEGLREQFLRWAFPLICQLRDRHFVTDLIDPRSGNPLLSSSGEICHDDVAAIAEILGWEIAVAGHCRAIVHPQWGTAVYPGIILSTASLPVLQSFLLEL
jgi:Methylmalonic aciduria and homocystinuria type D protein